MSKEHRFLPYYMDGDILQPVKDSEAEIYSQYLKENGIATLVQNSIADAVKDGNLLDVNQVLLSINKGYYKNLAGFMLRKFLTPSKPVASKKRFREVDEETEDEDIPLLEPSHKRFKSCKNCNGTGHTRPTCSKDCNCGVAPVHQGCSCPMLKKNKHAENTI